MGYLFFIFYILTGFIWARVLLAKEGLSVSVWAGGTAGIIFLMWSHVPFSFIFGFGILSHVLGLLLVLISTALLLVIRYLSHGGSVLSLLRLEGYRLRGMSRETFCMAAVVGLMTVYCLICLVNHTLYESDGAYYTGQCTYGDMNFHLGIITSIKEQGVFPPDYSIFPGQRLDYYFFSDSVSSSLYLLGCGLRSAYMLPMAAAFLFTFSGMWHLSRAILKRTSKALTAFVLFFFNGGLGLFYFLDGLKTDKENFTRIFTAYYETPTNYVNSGSRLSNICWTNTVVDMMLPQRATLFGWMALFLVLYLLYNAVFEDRPEFFLPAGILGGLLPMIQTYSYFTLGIAALVWMIHSLVRNRFRVKCIVDWLKFGLPAVILALPQFYIWIFGAVSGERFLRFEFNAYNSSDNWLWFWIKNVGVVFVLILPAFINAPRRIKIVHCAGALIFIICEFVVFQTHAYDNNKLYLMWYLFAAVTVADLLVDVFDKLREMKAVRVLAACALFVLCTSSAFFTMLREWNSGVPGNSYMLYDADSVKAAEFIRKNTEPDSLFMCCNNHNNTVSVLTGRNIFTGSGIFLYSHGVDYNGRADILRQCFTDTDSFERCRGEYGFDYIFISPYETREYGGMIEDHFREHYDLIFESGNVRIYDIRQKVR